MVRADTRVSPINLIEIEIEGSGFVLNRNRRRWVCPESKSKAICSYEDENEIEG